MTVTDRTAATDAEFRSRIAPFEAAPTPPEVREARVVEEVARALWDADHDRTAWEDATEQDRRVWLSLAAAAVAAYRAQDGGAEEAVRPGVDPAEIVHQRLLGWPDFHPEDFCHQCGRPNPTWFADTKEWREATHSTDDGGGILCPSCFCTLWEAETGKTAIIWRLSIDPRSRDALVPQALDKLRDELVMALRTSPDLPVLWPSSDRIAAALLPVVDRIANERATAELRAAAKVIRWDGLLHASDYAGYAAQLVDVRADELDPK